MKVPSLSSFQNCSYWLKSGIGSYWMSRGTYQLQATSEPGYRISIRGSLPTDGAPLHAGMVKTKSGWLTFAEAPSGDTPGAVLLATSGYLLCRSADEKVLLS